MSSGPGFLQGGVDDLRVYDHALTPAEVGALFGQVCAPVDRLAFSPRSLPVTGGEFV